MRSAARHAPARHLLSLVMLAVVAAAGCNAILGFEPGEARPGAGAAGGGGGGGGAGATVVSALRFDVLLAIDNSRAMADKQQLLAAAVEDLVFELVNPTCLDPTGEQAPVRPPGPLDACPEGLEREFPPVVDMHVGVISSSLGDHGGDVCPDDSAVENNNDMARLLARNASGTDLSVETYQGLGFLAWDPTQQLQPPGEAEPQAVIELLAKLVVGVGEQGCGFEAQLESWYRFLVDPDPPLTVELNDSGSQAVLEGIDDVLLAQRRDFLRPDSLLAIIVLSDENDCSIRDGSQYFYAAKAQSGAGMYHLPRAQITCETDPNDECCRSCGQSSDGCPDKGDECAEMHDNLSDAINLRCYNQKQRFGIDFLWPIDRYLTGLTSELVPDREGDLLPNPIFSDLQPEDDVDTLRDPSLVFLAGIVGVPWQDISRRDQNGQPNLLMGMNGSGDPVGGFQSAAELVANGTWDIILGDPSCYHTDPTGCLPTDPLMIESVDPRSGTHPIIGDEVAPPTAGYMANSINGHEWSNPLLSQRSDLQYACIFPLNEPRDCAGSPAPVSCDCMDPANDNPLCEDSSGANGQMQYFAKAYPSRRELELLQALGNQGIVTSICPANMADGTELDFGYRPAMRAIVAQLKLALEP